MSDHAARAAAVLSPISPSSAFSHRVRPPVLAGEPDNGQGNHRRSIAVRTRERQDFPQEHVGR
jgi:hypothetical protein